MHAMQGKKLRWLAFGAAGLAGLVLGTCGGMDTCGEPKCVSGAWMHIPVGAAPATLVGTTVQVCRNDECYLAAMPDLPTAGGAGATLYFAGATFVLGTYWQEADESIGLDLEWRVAGPEEAADGDHYVVTFVDAAGIASTMLDKIAVYRQSEPSPEECAHGARCRVVELTP